MEHKAPVSRHILWKADEQEAFGNALHKAIDFHDHSGTNVLGDLSGDCWGIHAS
jgi:hypothetical protein